MTMRRAVTVLLLFVVASRVCGDTATTKPADELTDTSDRFAVIARTLGPGGVDKDDVLTYSLPRVDLDLHTDTGAVPPIAVESRFHFFRCDCGKMNVVGQLAVADYEANDVIDALREAHIKVVSVGPMFTGEHPRVLAVRFQGEGGAETIAQAIKSAVEWTGEARMTTRPTK